MAIYAGIDPGQSGGIAFIFGQGVQAIKMPVTERDVWIYFNETIRNYRKYNLSNVCITIIEKVHSFPSQGIASSFKFGQNYGFLRGILVALEVKLIEVSPQRWQRDLNIPSSKGKTKTQHKNALKQRAQQLFPQLNITLATADALLIAYWGTRYGL